MSSSALRPNPSLEATATGKALGPRAGVVHHPSRGPSAFPASAPQLKRSAASKRGNMSEWPNHSSWSALREGDFNIGGKLYRFEVVDCGDLYLPSGRLVACDPFAGMDRGGNPYIQVPKGRFPVRVTIADVSGKADSSHIREAYASLILSRSAEAIRRVLTPLRKGEESPAISEGEFIGFGVDAGTACFVDDRALESSMPPEEEWLEGLFENDDPASWFARMDNPEHIRKGIANIPLPLAQSGENLVLFHSGWGDGVYPVVGGYDQDGNLVAVHIDLLVVLGETNDDEAAEPQA